MYRDHRDGGALRPLAQPPNIPTYIYAIFFYMKNLLHFRAHSVVCPANN